MSVSFSMITRSRVDEVGQQLVNGLPGTADHRGQVRLRIGPVEADLVGLGLGLTRQPRQAAGQPSGEVEEVELLHVSGDAPDLSREAGQQRLPQRLVAIEHLEEGLTRERQRLGRFQGHGRGRARSPVEQRQLAEEVTAAQGGDDGLLTLEAGQHDLDRARAHDVKGVAGITLMHDGLVAPEAAPPHVARDGRESVIVGTLEEVRVTQAGDDQLLVHVATMAGRHPPRQAESTSDAGCRPFDKRSVASPRVWPGLDGHATVTLRRQRPSRRTGQEMERQT